MSESGWLSEDIIFDGTGGADKFIRAVRKAAFNHGKHEDDIWCTQFASTCLEGRALDFYEELEEKTRGSWKLLRKALLGRFSSMISTSVEPIPAAAGPYALGPQTIHNPAAPPTSASGIQGFIRVVDRDSVTLGYISGTRNAFDTGLVISRDLAQVVHFRLHNLRLPVRQIPLHYRLKVMGRASDESSDSSTWIRFDQENSQVGPGSTWSATLDILAAVPITQPIAWILSEDGTLDCFWVTRLSSLLALWTLETAIDALDNGLKFFSDLKAASQIQQGFQKVLAKAPSL